MKKIMFMLLMLIGTSAIADSIGVDYAVTRADGVSAVSNGTWEGTYVHPFNAAITGVVQANLVNDHTTSGNKTELKAGAKIGLMPVMGVNPWVQPMVTARSISGRTATVAGYELGAGIDVKLAGLTITPAYKYSNNFGADKAAQNSFSLGASYPLTNVLSIDAKVQRNLVSAANNNAIYGGLSYKF